MAHLTAASDRTPVVKEFDAAWVRTLTRRGEPLVYTRANSEDFKYLGMPVGGLCAGQLYLGGDGKLWFWDIFNTADRTGRFYGFEGGYQGPGTCTHVWGYVHAPGRLFPALERSLREHTDFSPKPDGGFHPETGLIDFRGRFGHGLAVDGHSGVILRSYLTHQMQTDEAFLRSYCGPTVTGIERLCAWLNDDVS